MTRVVTAKKVTQVRRVHREYLDRRGMKDHEDRQVPKGEQVQ
jgi:hypothetical protein